MSQNDGHYWLTPPELLESLEKEFHFDFDPCPFPRPDGFNSLIIDWGKRNFVNPPFKKIDGPFGAASAFVKKAIVEAEKGNLSVIILPISWSLHLLMEAGAEIRYIGPVYWINTQTGEKGHRKRPQVIGILKGKGQ